MMTRLLLTASLAIFLVPVASAQSLGVDLSATADVTGATSAAYDAKAQAEGLVADVQAKADGAIADVQAEADGLQAKLAADASATSGEALSFGEKAKAAFQGAIEGFKGFAATIAASLSVG